MRGGGGGSGEETEAKTNKPHFQGRLIRSLSYLELNPVDIESSSYTESTIN